MMATILWIGAIAVCCGLCAYGIKVAVRRANARREAQALAQR
jgi:hypothetical protein